MANKEAEKLQFNNEIFDIVDAEARKKLEEHSSQFITIANQIKNINIENNPIILDILKRIGILEDYHKEKIYNLPILKVTGDTTGMSKTESKVLNGEFLDVYGDYIFKDKKIEMNWQGSSSIWYDKKNYSIDIFESDGTTKYNHIFFDDVDANNGYHLKANFIDAWHCRNIVTVNLAKEMYKKSLPNNPRGCIDGFPIILEINGEKQGLYTFNLKQHKTVYRFDKTNPNHLMYRANTNSSDTCNFKALSSNNAEDIETDWEDRFPKTNTAENREKLNRLISFIKDSDNETFKSNFSQYLDLDYTIDYWILIYFGGFTDSISKNMNLVTYDGLIWYPTFYDCDTTWGISWNGSEQKAYNIRCPEDYQATDNILWQKLTANFKQEIYDRYYELRNNYLDCDKVIDRFKKFIDLIPQEEYDYDRAKWAIPTASINSGILFLKTWIKNRSEYVDSKMNELLQVSVPLESITITSTLRVTKGQSAKIDVTYTPLNATNKNVTWDSNNDTIATVDIDGNVTAIGEGTCTITCTSEDGAHIAQCSIVVSLPELVQDSLIYNFDFRGKQADENKKYTSTVNGLTASFYKYDSSNVTDKGFNCIKDDYFSVANVASYFDLNVGFTLEGVFYNNLPNKIFSSGQYFDIQNASGTSTLTLFDTDENKISNNFKWANVINSNSVITNYKNVIDTDNLIHFVLRVYPTGKHEVFVNNCKSSYTIDTSKFDHFNANMINTTISIMNPYQENVIVATYRAYSRPLTDDEIRNNFYIEKNK